MISLLEFNRGQIFYDSIEINQLSLDWVRANLIYLPQEPKFVDGTMLNNLLGQNQIKKDKMTEILRSVDLLDFINSDLEITQFERKHKKDVSKDIMEIIYKNVKKNKNK